MTTNTRLPRAWKPAWNVALGHARTLLLCLCVASSLHGADGGPRPLPSPDAARAYRLSNADASTVASQLKTMFSECGVAAEVLIDRSRNSIVVQGSEQAQQLAVQMIEALDKTPVSRVTAAAAEQRSGVKGYAVVPEKLEAVARDLTGRFPPSLGARIAADARTSQVVVIAPESLHADITAYLESMPGVLADNPPAPRPLGAAGAQRYRLQHVTWREFADSLRNLWGDSLVIETERAGETVSVRGAADTAGPPVMQIDCRTNDVAFTGRADTRGSWRQIAVALDRAKNSRGGTTQLVPLHRADPEKVHEAITMIRDASLRSQPGETMAALPVSRRSTSRTASGLVSMIFQPQEPAGQPGGTPPAGQPAGEPGGTPPAGEPAGEPGETGDAPIDADAVGMLGDVQVEYIPELGVLILRGNQKDVQRVQKIIAAIEQQSLATAPAIEVVPMQHSNSESLATLITQIYGEVYEPRLGSLSITALVKPNAILFVGRTENIAAAMELVVKLDTEVAPEAQIKVFRLLHMPAVNAEQYLENFYGTTTATGQTTQGQATVRGLSTRVTVISDFRSNSLIVQASPRDLSEVAKLLEELDVESTPATIELRVFPLRNSLATDMQTVIRSALTAQGQTAQAGFQTQQFQTPTQTQTQNQTSRSVQIVGIDQKGNKIIESGILTDVTVTADVNANSLVVRAPARSMGLVAELIEQLDKVPAAESQIKVFQIANGDATNLASMLQTLFGQQVTTGSIGAFSQTFGRTFGTGAGLVQSTAGESSLIPLNFGVDARTNSIVVSGSAEDLAVVEAILLRLDEGDLRQRQLTVYRLNNAPAQYVSDALTQILTEQQNLLRQQQSQVFSLISQFEVIDQQVFVVPEVISNTLIVSALPKYYEQITKVIEDLDRRPPMIMIQVVVALMRLDEGEEFGAELGIQDSLLFDRGIVGTTLTPGFNFANSPLGNSGSAQSLATREMLAGQAFGAFNMGRSSASEGFPGLVLSAGSESLSVLIRALAKKSRVQILSRPQIMTMNNIPASVLIGQRVPQITDFQTTNVGTVNSVDLIEVGVSLGVIPRVTPDGLIIMDIEARDSKVGDPSEGIPIGVQDGIAINSPIFDDITAITTIAARSGQTVVFGGLIASERTEAFRGVPYLSQIPIVGHLFRYDTKSDERRELIFFLTPHIVLGSEEIETINQRESQRMSWCLADVVNVHGDPGFAASGTDCWGQGTPVIYPHLDPTAEGAVMLDSAEPIPHPSGRSVTLPPQGRSLVLPPSEGREGAPFILPPEQRTEGKPFVLPPDQHTEGEPFILPPEQRTPGKPFVEPQPGRLPPSAPPGTPDGANWQPPALQPPWQAPPQSQPLTGAAAPQYVVPTQYRQPTYPNR